MERFFHNVFEFYLLGFAVLFIYCIVVSLSNETKMRVKKALVRYIVFLCIVPIYFLLNDLAFYTVEAVLKEALLTGVQSLENILYFRLGTEKYVTVFSVTCVYIAILWYTFRSYIRDGKQSLANYLDKIM